jgi:hypothetical protein
VILSYQRRFLFLKTRKTGGTSIELALSPVAGPDAIVTRLARDDEAKRRASGDRARNVLYDQQAPLRNNRKYYNHIKAPIVRERVGETLWNGLFKFSVERNPWDRQVSRYHWRQSIEGRWPTFDAYMEHKGARFDNFGIYSIGGEIVADFMIRFERLNEDFTTVLARLGLSGVSLPHAKGSHRPKGAHYSTYYTDATRKRVAEWYAAEIEAFGYRFETE